MSYIPPYYSNLELSDFLEWVDDQPRIRLGDDILDPEGADFLHDPLQFLDYHPSEDYHELVPLVSLQENNFHVESQPVGFSSADQSNAVLIDLTTSGGGNSPIRPQSSSSSNFVYPTFSNEVHNPTLPPVKQMPKLLLNQNQLTGLFFSKVRDEHGHRARSVDFLTKSLEKKLFITPTIEASNIQQIHVDKSHNTTQVTAREVFNYTLEWLREAAAVAAASRVESGLSDDVDHQSAYTNCMNIITKHASIASSDTFKKLAGGIVANNGTWTLALKDNPLIHSLFLGLLSEACQGERHDWEDRKQKIYDFMNDFSITINVDFVAWLLSELNDRNRLVVNADDVKKFADRMFEIQPLLNNHVTFREPQLDAIHPIYQSFLEVKLMELEFANGDRKILGSHDTDGVIKRQYWFHMIPPNKKPGDMPGQAQWIITPCMMKFNEHGGLSSIKPISQLDGEDKIWALETEGQMNQDIIDLYERGDERKDSFKIIEDAAALLIEDIEDESSCNENSIGVWVYRAHRMKRARNSTITLFNIANIKGNTKVKGASGETVYAASNLHEFWNGVVSSQIEAGIDMLGPAARKKLSKRVRKNVVGLLPIPKYASEIKYQEAFESISHYCKLKPYQKEELKRWILAHESSQGRICNLEMGLGKTYIGTVFFLYLHMTRNQDTRPLLVVAPAACIKNWEKVIKKLWGKLEKKWPSETEGRKPNIILWHAKGVQNTDLPENAIIITNFEFLGAKSKPTSVKRNLIHSCAGIFCQGSFTTLFSGKKKEVQEMSKFIFNLLVRAKIIDKSGVITTSTKRTLVDRIVEAFLPKDGLLSQNTKNKLDHFAKNLVNFIENNQKGFMSCIVDEVQRANVADTNNHKVLMRIKKDTTFALTGTLLENSINDPQYALRITDPTIKIKPSFNEIIAPQYKEAHETIKKLIKEQSIGAELLEEMITEAVEGIKNLHEKMIILSRGIAYRTTRLKTDSHGVSDLGLIPQKIRHPDIMYPLTQQQSELHREIETTLDIAVNKLGIMRVEEKETSLNDDNENVEDQIQSSSSSGTSAPANITYSAMSVLQEQVKILYHPCLCGPDAKQKFYSNAIKKVEYETLARNEISQLGGPDPFIELSGYTKALFDDLNKRIHTTLRLDPQDQHGRFTQESVASDVAKPNKICIIQQSTPNIFILQELIKQKYHNEVDVHVYYGGMNIEEKRKATESFNDIDAARPQIIILALKAGGTGINVYAHDVYTEEHWNPAWIDQAEARSCRGGSPYKEIVYHSLMCSDPKTLSHKIRRKVEKKRTLAALFEDNHTECYHPQWLLKILSKEILETCRITDTDITALQEGIANCTDCYIREQLVQKRNFAMNIRDAFNVVLEVLSVKVAALPQRELPKSVTKEGYRVENLPTSSSSNESSSSLTTSLPSSSTSQLSDDIAIEICDATKTLEFLKRIGQTKRATISNLDKGDSRRQRVG